MMRRAIASLFLVCIATIVTAHSKTEGSTPSDGETVAEVSELLMRFDDPMRIITITLESSTGPVAIDRLTGMEPVTVFRAVPAVPLTSGAYVVEWRGMAADGHPMQGGFSFTVAD